MADPAQSPGRAERDAGGAAADPAPPPDGFTELGHFEVHERAVRLLGYRYCLERLVVVLGEAEPDDGRPLTLGMLHPEDESLLAEVRRLLGRPVVGVGLNSHEVERALAIGWGLPVPATPAARTPEHVLRPVERLSFDAALGAPDIVDQLLALAVQRGASDVHIEAYEDDVDVRLRVDGVLRQLRTPVSHANLRNVVARIKVLTRLDVTERRRAQDGRLQAEFHVPGQTPREVDFRVSVLPGLHGEDVVLRVMDAGAGAVELGELGLGADDLQRLSDVACSPEGLLLVTGPTGSGKTTTLYALLARINATANKVITVEDPVERQLGKVSQKQVSAHMGFADFTRAFMRQDPDVILVGEIRDAETADAAVRAAQTGHLVLSTLHTIDATRAVSRLSTLGVDSELLGAALVGVVAQRLARRLCEQCREAAEPTPEQRRRLRLAGGDAEGFQVGRGCGACGGDGTRGRIGIYELLLADAALADLLVAGAPVQRLREHALAQGMRSLLRDAMAKARAGLIPLSEVLRVVPYRMIAAGE